MEVLFLVVEEISRLISQMAALVYILTSSVLTYFFYDGYLLITVTPMQLLH